MTPDEAQAARVRFDWSINLGHVFTVLSFLIVALFQWSLMDKRITVLEEARYAQREKDSIQDAARKEKFDEVRAALIDLRGSVDKLNERLSLGRR